MIAAGDIVLCAIESNKFVATKLCSSNEGCKSYEDGFTKALCLENKCIQIAANLNTYPNRFCIEDDVCIKYCHSPDPKCAYCLFPKCICLC